MSSTILDCFSKISSEHENERVVNTVKLLRHLSQLVSQGEDGTKELNYALKRIIRSLGSPRALNRKSNYSVFTTFLSSHPELPLSTLYDVMENELETSTSNSKSEQAEIYLGRILFCGAIITSNLLEKFSEKERNKVLECLVLAGKKRNYLTPCLAFCTTSFIIEYLNKINEETFASIWPILEKDIMKSWNEQTTDSLYLLLIIKDKFPNVIKPQLKITLEGTKILSRENMQHVYRVLTDIPRIMCSEHPIYEMVCQKISEKTELVKKLWEKIEEKYQKPSKTDEQIATNILTHLLNNVTDKSVIPSLLSNNFLQYMLQKCVHHKKGSKDVAVEKFKNILTKVASILDANTEAEVHIAVIKKLMLCPGELMMEKKLGVKVVNRIMTNLSVEGVEQLAGIFRSIADNSTNKERHGLSSETWTNAERIYAAQLLIRLLGHPKMIEEDNWRLEQLKFFFKSGFAESQNFGAELSEQFKASFYRAVDQKFQKLSKARKVFNSLICWLNKSIFEKQKLKLRNPLSATAQESWAKMMMQVKKLENSSENVAAIFHMMYLHMGLQLFVDQEMAISSIDELNSCQEKIKKKKSKSNKSLENGVEEPLWVEVVVDWLLSILSIKNHLLRSMVNCVFPHICQHLTAYSIHQILRIFDVQKSKDPLRSNSDDEFMDSDSEEEKSENGEEENMEDESDSDFEEDIDDDEEDEGVTERLRMALRQALGNNVVMPDDEDADGDIDVDQIDEAEGKRIDESISSAFKMLRESRKQRKHKQPKSAETLTHFRTRVIDLLVIYLDHEPSIALVVDMIVPLFLLLEFCIKDHHQKPLENRIRSCLKMLAGVKKFRNVEGVDQQVLLDVLKMLMEKGERSASIYHEMGDNLAECCTFLVRCIQQHPKLKNATNEVVKIYCENLKTYFKKSVLPPSLFRNVLQLCWDGNWSIAPLLVDFAFDPEIRSFRRSPALDFLITFYQNSRLLQSTDSKTQEIRESMERKICDGSIGVLGELGSGKKLDVNQKYISLLFTLLKEIFPQHLKKCWNWKEIGRKMAEYKASATMSNDAKAAYKKLAVLVKPPNDVVSKKITNGSNSEKKIEKASEESEPEQEAEQVSKKKKRKPKKEWCTQNKAKKLRAMTNGQGLEVDFSTAFENINQSDEM